MMALDFIVAVLSLSALGLLSGSFIQMMRAQTDQERQSAERTLTAALIAGVIIAVAPSVAQWITGYDYDDDTGMYCPKGASTKAEGCLPPDVSGTLYKVVHGVMALGGVIIVLGLVWGGIQMGRRKRSSPSSSKSNAAGSGSSRYPTFAVVTL